MGRITRTFIGLFLSLVSTTAFAITETRTDRFLLRPTAAPNCVQKGLMLLDSGDADTLKFCDGSNWYDVRYGLITNDQVDASAAIDYTKLDLSDSITNSDVNSAAAIDYSKLDLNGSIQDSDLDPSSSIVLEDATQTLTNKTIDGDSNTVQDLPLSAIKTDAGAANTFISRDGDGEVISTKAVPSGDVVGTNDSQVLTGKDIDGGTASNTSRITIPKAPKASLDALTRKQATMVFASDENKAYIDDGSALVPVGSGSANDWGYVENGGVEVDATGWSVSGGTGARTTTAGQVLKGEGAYAWNPSASSQTITFPSFTIPAGGIGNCEARFWAKGGGTANIDFVVKTGSTEVSNVATVSSAYSGWQPIALQFTCTETAATDYFVEGESQGDAAEIYFDEYYGGEYQTFQVAQAKVLLHARRGTSNQTISTTAATVVAFNTAVYDPFSLLNTSTGEVTLKENGLLEVDVSLLVNNVSTDSSGQYAFVRKNGVNQNCDQYFSTASSVAQVSAAGCIFEAAAGDVITVTSASDSDASYNVNNAAASRVIIKSFPTASEQVLKIGAPYSELTSFTVASTITTNATHVAEAVCTTQGLFVTGKTTFSGTNTQGTFEVDLPSPYVMDATDPLATDTNATLGFTTFRDADGSASLQGNVRYVDTNTVRLTVNGSSGTYTTNLAINTSTNVPATVASGDVVFWNYTVPVIGCPRTPMPLVKQAVVYDTTVKAEGAAGVTSIASGTYTPTAIGVENISSVGTTNCMWSRLANIVNGSCRIDPTCTSTSNTTTRLDIPLPVASNFTQNYDANGTGNTPLLNGEGLTVLADTSNDRLQVSWLCGGNTGRRLVFQYEVK